MIVLLVAVFVGRQIVAGAWRRSPVLGGIVAAYMLVIGLVVVVVGSGAVQRGGQVKGDRAVGLGVGLGRGRVGQRHRGLAADVALDAAQARGGGDV